MAAKPHNVRSFKVDLFASIMANKTIKIKMTKYTETIALVAVKKCIVIRKYIVN